MTEFFDFSAKKAWKIAVSKASIENKDEHLFDAFPVAVVLPQSYLKQRESGIEPEQRSQDLALISIPPNVIPADFSPTKIAVREATVKIGEEILLGGFGLDPFAPPATAFSPHALRVATATLFAKKAGGAVISTEGGLSATDQKYTATQADNILFIKDSIHGTCPSDSGGAVFRLTEFNELELVGVNFTGTCRPEFEVHSRATDITAAESARFLAQHLGAEARYSDGISKTAKASSLGLANRFGCDSRAAVGSRVGTGRSSAPFTMEPSKAYHLQCNMDLGFTISALLFRNYQIYAFFGSDAHYCGSCVDASNGSVFPEREGCLNGQARCRITSTSPSPIMTYNDQYLQTTIDSPHGKYSVLIPHSWFTGAKGTKKPLVLTSLPVFPVCEAKIVDREKCEFREENISDVNPQLRFMFEPYLKIDPNFKFK